MKEYGVEQKCRVVLSVWTERRKATEVMKELGLSPTLFWQWQDRALSGMLDALTPRNGAEGTTGPALPEAVKRLLERKLTTRELRQVGLRKRKPKEAAPLTE